MTVTTLQLCTRLFPDGHTCGSPALRGERLCYYHHPSRHPVARHRPTRGFTLTAPTNHRELQLALSEVIRRLAANKIDTRRAGVLLYSLQLAGQALPTCPPWDQTPMSTPTHEKITP
jgi:hypothetical protein